MPDISSPAPACHVVCLLLALLVQHSYQQSCGEQASCRGDRPRLPTGCCPVEAGQVCRPANGENCDVELGFLCKNENGERITAGTGICRGRYNFHVVATGENDTELSWNEFAPPGYAFEYVILFREGSNHYDVSAWTTKEIGDRPFYKLTGLTPATLYFIKVAIWADAQTLGNTSETIMVETRPLEFCTHRGSNYIVGEPFVHNCEDNCTCMPTGKFQCQPLCPERGVPEVEEGCHVTSGDECCDYKIACPVGGEQCEFNGETIPHGTEVEDGCRVCTCQHGQLDCVYPQSCHVMEPTASCPNPQSRDVEGECCPEWYCPELCHYEDRTYTHLEYFTSAHCGLCQCDTTDSVQCAPDCPPVVMVLPDASCPDPHVRQDGCCDTLHCFDPSLDIEQFVRRMFALSYSPVTLTLSFEVNPQSEENGVPLYCQYEILYANTSDPLVTWHRRLVQPVDVRLNYDQSYNVEPTEALTRDNAIVVGDRAYVTLSGMHPNTTYYVKIIPLDGRMDDTTGSASGQLNTSDSRNSAMVVVKTLPLDNVTSCFHNGKEVLHGEPVNSHCSQSCTCIMGKVSCHSACEEESVVMATSPSCPQPRFEKREGDCCPEWTCHPAASGCLHNGLILESGQSVTEACHVCTCLNKSMHCRSVCPPQGQPPRLGCELVNVSGLCCPQWKCPRETHLPYRVQFTMLIHFNGSCDHPVSSFMENLQQQVFQHVISHMGCTNSQSELHTFCDAVQVQVSCPNLSLDGNKHRKRRSTIDNIDGYPVQVAVSLHKNFSSSTSYKQTVQSVHFAGLKLASLLNSSFSIGLDSGHVISSSDMVSIRGLTFVCDPGFSFYKDACVLSEIESSLSFKANIQLSASQVTSSSVTIQWSALGEQVLRHVSGLMVEHRKEGTVQWLASLRLDPSVTVFTLSSLSSDQEFSARLVAVTEWSGKERWVIGEVSFRTRPISDASVSSLILSIREVVVTESTAFLYWDPLPSEFLSQISAVIVLYKKTHENHYSKEQKVSPITTTNILLQNLDCDTGYTVEVSVLLTSGATVTSHPVHFVTKSSYNHSTELLVAVIISCVVTTVAAVIVILTCVLWRRSRRKSGNTGFENKTYGIQLENNNDELHGAPAACPAAD